jgi:L-asparaginase/beta-aspartyl-peptidase (threonine type)
VGAVINIRNVKNPVVVAQALTNTPHVALAGRGAEAFAEKIGAEPFPGVSEKAVERYERIMKLLREGKIGEINPRWKDADESFYKIIPSDTIGAVALDRKGIFAVAASTGGASPMMVGRVGDTPMIGCGFYAGPGGAVAATGLGEEIIKRMLAKTVYDYMDDDGDIESACRKGIGLFGRGIAAGLIGISKMGFAVSANRPIAHYAMVRKTDA